METPPFDVALMLGKEFGDRAGWKEVLKEAKSLAQTLDSVLVRVRRESGGGGTGHLCSHLCRLLKKRLRLSKLCFSVSVVGFSTVRRAMAHGPTHATKLLVPSPPRPPIHARHIFPPVFSAALSSGKGQVDCREQETQETRSVVGEERRHGRRQ